MKRRKGIKGKRMHRLRVLISESSYEKLRSFAPDYGGGALVEHMIEREAARRQRSAEKPPHPEAKVSP